MPKTRKRTAKVSAETSDNMSTEAQLSKLDKDNKDVTKVNRSTKPEKQGESVVSVLVGAVQSGDLELVSSVLSSADTDTREDTVLGLPLETVMPLLTSIQACLRKGICIVTYVFYVYEIKIICLKIQVVVWQTPACLSG